MDWKVKQLNRKNYKEEICNPDYPVLVAFRVDWCPSCRAVEPIFAELAGEFAGNVLFREINTDFYPRVAGEYNIAGVPTLVLFQNKKETWRHVGAVNKKRIEEVLKQFK